MPIISYMTRITNSGSSIPRFNLRWFGPLGHEAKLCGHGTLAAAHILFTSCLDKYTIVEFSTLSGILTTKRISEMDTSGVTEVQENKTEDCSLIELDLPVVQVPDHTANIDYTLLSTILNGVVAIETRMADNDYLIIELSSWKDVVDFQPEFDKIKAYPAYGLVITGLAPADSDADFYSRVFFPKWGVNEDFICGSAHCALAHYWSKKLGKVDFVARPASSRGGIMQVHFDQLKHRVLLRGKAIKIVEGSIFV